MLFLLIPSALALMALVLPLRGQSLIASQSFEDPSTDLVAIPYLIEGRFLDRTDRDYFAVIPNTAASFRGEPGGPLNGSPLVGGDGSRVLGADDLDRQANGTGSPSRPVTFGPLDVAGWTNLRFEVLLAAPGDVGSTPTYTYDYAAAGSAFNDGISVLVSYDGAAFQELDRFRATGAENSRQLSRDKNRDDVGDGEVYLDRSLANFSYDLANATSTISLRLIFTSTSSREYLVADHLRVFGETAQTSPPVLAGLPAEPIIYAEGDPAQPVSSEITIIDTDSTISQASVSIDQGYQNGEDILAAERGSFPGTINFTTATGVLSFTGPATAEQYQEILQTVTYVNTETARPNTSSRRLRITANDGSNDSNTLFRSLVVLDTVDTQSLPYEESFETDGAGIRYSHLGRFNFSPENERFDRVSSVLTNVEGSFAIEAEETDSTQGIKAIVIPLDTSTQANVTLQMLVAAPGGSTYDREEELLVEARIAGADFEVIGSIQSTGDANDTTLSLDEDLDGSGDGITVLDATFQDLSFDLPSAKELELRVRFGSTSPGENLFIDDLRIRGEEVNFTVVGFTAEEGEPLAFKITRSTRTGVGRVDYAVTAGTAQTADFTAISGTAHFADGETELTVEVSTIEDLIDESDETIVCTLSNPVAGSLTGTPSATGTVLDDDDPAIFSVADATTTEGEPLSFTVSRNIDAGSASVDFSVIAGSAQAGIDFITASGTVRFSDGATTGKVEVRVNQDTLPEFAETVTITLSNPSGGVLPESPKATGTIIDDDLITRTTQPGMPLRIRKSEIEAVYPGEFFVSVFEGVTESGSEVKEYTRFITFTPAPGLLGETINVLLDSGIITLRITVETEGSPSSTLNITTISSPDPSGVVTVTAFGILGRTYQLQSSTDLKLWTDSGSSQTALPTSRMIFTSAPSSASNLFFRVVQP